MPTPARLSERLRRAFLPLSPTLRVRQPRRPHLAEPLETRIAPAAVLGVTKVASFGPGNVGDVNGNGTFDPGDTIYYTVTLANNGTVDLTGVKLSDIVDANTTVGTNINVSPLPFNDTFTAVANTLLEVGVTHGAFPAAQVAGSVTANDMEFLGDTFTLKTLQATNFSGGTATAASAQGGSVTMNASGNFTYLPAVGFTGTDTFTYTIADKGLDGIAGNADDLTNTATVTITVGTQKVWYVDNSYTGANGASDGRSTRPFTSITATNLNGPGGVGDVDGVGDIIYIHAGTGAAYTGGIALEGNQTLHGQGEILQVGGFTLNAAGTAPLLTNVGGTVVALSNAASNVNTLKGLTIGDSNIDISGSSFGTLNINNTVTLNGTGKAFDLTTGALNATLAGLTVTSSTTEGIKLTGITGTLAANTGSLAGIAGDDLFISGGTANITLGISDTNTAGHSVNIAGKSGGTLNFGGLINDTGTGLLLSNNTGATFHFTGGITASTGANQALTATGGGTIDVTGANNTLTTTTGTALDIENTTISASGLTFKSITAGTTTGGPAYGIDLDATGLLGGLTVTGAGAAGTGGTLQHATHGVFARSTTGLSLSWMAIINNGLNQTVAGSASTAGGDLVTGNNLSAVANVTLFSDTNVSLLNDVITGSSQMGINGNAVNGLTITNSTITGNGNESFESGIVLQNATGTVSITGSNVRDNRARELQIANGSGTMTLNTSGSQYGHTAAGTGTAETQQGILLQLFGTSNTTINASSLTISNNEGVGFTANGFQINADNGGPVVNGSITGSTFDNNAAHVLVNAGGTSTVTFDTKNNLTMTKAALQAINYTILGGSTAITANLTGTISGNVINNSALPNANADAIDINSGSTWAGQMHIKVDGNNIQGVSGGIIATLDGNDTAGAATPRVDLRITNNTISNPVATAAQEAIKLNAAVTSAHSKLIVGWDVGGAGAQNIISGHWANGASEASIFLRNRFTAAASIILPGYGGGAADDAAVQTYLAGRNTITAPGGTGVSTLVTHNNTNPFTSGTVTTPLLYQPTPGDVVNTPAPGTSGATANTTPPAVIVPSGDTGASVVPPPVIVDDGVLSQAELDSLVGAAIARWEATGLTPAQVALLHHVTFSVADLPAWYLGEASPGHVTLDVNAAGNTWFIDPTPNDDSEFTGSGSEKTATATGGAAGRIDAFSTVLHELGHQLGLDDTYASADSGNLMYGYIHQSERRLPVAHQAEHAVPHLAAGDLDFATLPVTIGNLPVGKTVQVQFSATINSGITASSVSNTGTGSSNETGDVASNTVVTAINLPDVNVAVSPASVNEDGFGILTYTFTREGAGTNAQTVNFSIAGTASAANDYTVSSGTGTVAFTPGTGTGTITFAAGATTATLILSPTDDTTVESNETAILTVTAGTTGYDVGTTPTAAGTILNDDTATVTVTAGSVAEGNSGTTNLPFTVTLSNPVDVDTTVQFSTADGTATTANSDYVAQTLQTVTILAGQTSAIRNVLINGDTTSEPNETFTGTISSPSASGRGVTLGTPATATATIVNDDSSLHAAIDGSGNLTISDISASGASNNLTVRLISGGTQLEITDAAEVFDGTPTTTPASTLSNGGRTLTIPFSSVTGGLTLNTAGGADTVTLDLSGGNFIHAAGVDFDGGNPTVTTGDKLVIAGGSQGTVTYNHTSASAGNIVMSNFGTVRYLNLEDGITNNGTATDVIFNLPGTGNSAFLEDNGATPADGLLRIRSSPFSFEQTDFAIPSNSLTLNTGTGNDTLTLSATPQFTAGLTINGGQGDDTINLNSAITFQANKNLNVNLQDDDATPGIDTITMSTAGNLVLSGTGAAIFKASRNIQFAGHLATENGDITLEANQQATAASGNFVGVNVLGTSVTENTGTGHINILGRGGNDAAGAQYGFRTNTGALVRGGTSGDAVTITGTGGVTGGNGVFIPNGAVRSLGGNILFTGIGTGTGTGITIQNSGVVSPAAGGNVILDATTATPTSATAAFNLFTVATNPTGVFTTGGGSITVIADSVSIGTTNAFSFLDAGATGTVTLRPHTNGTAINVGNSGVNAAAGQLDLSDAELDRIIANTLQIGDANSGTIRIVDVISPNTYQTLSIGKAASFVIDSANGTTGGFASDVFSATNYEKIVAAGAVSIDPAATLTVTAQGGYVPTASDVFTLINNTSVATTTGAFAGKPEGSTVAVGGFDTKLTYVGGTGNDVVLQGTTVGVTVGTSPVVESSATGLVYTFTRSGDLTGALPVSFGKSGTAVAADYTATSSAGTFDFSAGTLTIPAGASSVTVTLVPVNDRLVEGDESATLTVAAGSGYGVSGSPATGTITDNDTATLHFTSGTSAALESAGTQNISVTLDFVTSGTGTIGLASNLTANLTTSSGTATGGGTDYTLPGSPAVTFLSTADYSSGTATQNAALTIVDDKLVEGSETAGLGLVIVQNIGTQVSLGGTTAHTLTITDNDTATLHFTAGTSTALESAGTQNIGVTLDITAIGTGTTGLASNLTANLTSTGGTATGGGTDYTLPGSPAVTFLAGTYAGGTTTQSAAVTIVDDKLVEGSETAILGLIIGSNIGTQVSLGGTTAHTLTITDNDTATLHFTTGTSTALESVGTQNIGVTLDITAIGTGTTGLASNLTANLTSTGGTATGGGTDYTLPGSPAVTFLATADYSSGTATQNAVLTIVDDKLVEGSETAALGLSIVSNIGTQVNVGGTTAHTLTITDNDTATLHFTTGTSTALESVGTQNIGVTLDINAIGTGTTGLGSNFTANLTTTGGTATGGGADYTLPGTPAVTFLATGDYSSGTATQNAALSIVDDKLVEGSETAALGLSIVSNIGTQVSVGGTTAHTLTITDNDTATLHFTSGTSSALESVGTQNIGVTLDINAIGTGTMGLGSNFTANLTTTGGTATGGGTDYTLPGSPAVTFLATGDYSSGTATQNAALTIVDDKLVEGSETAVLGLSIVSNIGTQVSVGGTTAHTLTITDNDTATLHFTSGTSSALESVGTQNIGVTLDITAIGTGTIGLASNFTANLTTTGGTATGGGVDYTLPGSPAVTFLAGSYASSTQNVGVTIIDDHLVEGDETAALGLAIVSNIGAQVSLGGTTAHTLTIVDNDFVDLAVTKTGPTTVISGTDATYSITVTNNGNATAQSVVLSDLLPSGLAFVSQSEQAGDPAFTLSNSGSQITDTIATLAAGATAHFTLVGHLGASVLEGTSLAQTATVSNSITDSTPGNNSSTVNTTAHAQADLSVVKTGPVTGIAGDLLTYQITTHNAGPSDAQSVSTADLLPSGSTLVSFVQNSGPANGSALPAGGTETFTLVVRTAAASASGSVVHNQATVSSPTSDLTTADHSSTVDTTLSTQSDLAITKTGPASATAGTDATYTITVTNPGLSDAQTVSLSDLLPAGMTYVSQTQTAGPAFTLTQSGSQITDTIATFASGASATFTVVGHLAANVAEGTAVSETASVTTATTELSTANNSSTQVTTVHAVADLAVSKSAANSANAGTDLTYTVVVTNNGASDAQNVSLLDTLPSGLTLTSVTQTSGPAFTITPAGNQLTGTAATLAAGASATFQVVGHLGSGVAEGTVLTNTATASADTSDNTPGNNSASASTTVHAVADLSLTNTDAPNPVTAGTQLTYTLHYANAGSSDALSVSLSDPLPAHTSFVSVTAPAGWTRTDSVAAGQGGTLTFTKTSLTAAESGDFAVVVKVDANTASGSTLSDTATLATDTTDSTPANNTATAATTVATSADLAITKTGAPTALPNSDYTYSIHLVNNGPSDAQSVSVSDVLPAGMTIVSTTAPGSFAAGLSSGAVTFTTSSFASGATSDFTITVHTSSGSGGTTLNNTATVSSSTFDSDTRNNSSTISTLVGGVDLQVTKTDNATGDTVIPGQLVLYTLSYTNHGYATSTGVQLNEMVPANAVFDLNHSSGGWGLADGAAAGSTASLSLPNLAVSDTGTKVFAVRILSAVAAGQTTVSNTASISDDGMHGTDLTTSDNTSTHTDTLNAAPDLKVLVGATTPGYAERGGGVSYPVSATNLGNQDATGVILQERLPAHTTFDSAHSPGWTAAGGGTYTHLVGNLAVGATSLPVPFAVFIDQTITHETAIVDNVSVADDGANGTDPIPGNNATQVSTPIYQGIYAVAQGITYPNKFGPPTVKVYDPVSGAKLLEFDAYESTLKDSVRVAVADMNGDGIDDIITTTGSGTGRLRVFDGLTGQQFTSGPWGHEVALFRGDGAFVAAGDVTGDGRADIVVGSGLGAGGFSIYNGVTGQPVGAPLSFPFGTAYHGGVRVAVGDVNGDGLGDVVIGMGGEGSLVKVTSGTSSTVLAYFRAGSATYSGGISVATGDLDGDHKADLIIGSNAGAPSAVAYYKIAAGQPVRLGPVIVPFGSAYDLGVRVGAVDINLDGIADIIVGAGGNQNTSVNIYDGANPGSLLRSFNAFPEYPNSSVFVAGSSPVPTVPVTRLPA